MALNAPTIQTADGLKMIDSLCDWYQKVQDLKKNLRDKSVAIYEVCVTKKRYPTAKDIRELSTHKATLFNEFPANVTKSLEQCLKDVKGTESRDGLKSVLSDCMLLSWSKDPSLLDFPLLKAIRTINDVIKPKSLPPVVSEFVDPIESLVDVIKPKSLPPVVSEFVDPIESLVEVPLN